MVGSLSFGLIVFSILVSLLLPIGSVYWLSKRGLLSWKAMGAGIIVFLLFAMALEQLFHHFAPIVIPGLKTALDNPWAFGLYGALAAGIFEETGRWLAFSLILKRSRSWGDGVSYGLGHGGIESILVGTLGFVQIIVFAVLINNGSFDAMVGSKLPPDQAAFIKNMLLHTSPWAMALGGLERGMALIIQVALSLVVLVGVRRKRISALLLAILLHALFDFGPALYQKGMLSIWAVEGILLVLCIPAAWWVFNGSRKYFTDEVLADASALQS